MTGSTVDSRKARYHYFITIFVYVLFENILLLSYVNVSWNLRIEDTLLFGYRTMYKQEYPCRRCKMTLTGRRPKVCDKTYYNHSKCYEIQPVRVVMLSLISNNESQQMALAHEKGQA